jgi:hypothetical protein
MYQMNTLHSKNYWNYSGLKKEALPSEWEQARYKEHARYREQLVQQVAKESPLPDFILKLVSDGLKQVDLERESVSLFDTIHDILFAEWFDGDVDEVYPYLGRENFQRIVDHFTKLIKKSHNF